MQQRKLIGAAAVAAVAGTAVALTLPALADTQPDPAPPTRTLRASEAAAALLPALQRDLKLNRAAAIRSLDAQAALPAVAGQARQQAGRSFAGAWVDPTGGVKVAVTDAGAAAQVRAVGAQPVTVTRTAADLTAAQAALDNRRDRLPKSIAGWHINVATNKLTILARPHGETTARRYAAQAGIPTDTITIETVDHDFRALHDVRGGDAYYINSSARCSIGFAVTTGFVSAGHCGRTGARTTGFNKVAQGTFRVSKFGGTNGNDYAVIDVNTNWTPKPVVATTNGDITITGSADPTVGLDVCRTGSTTGTRCGKITATNVTLNVSGTRVKGFINTTACAQSGDSGGSLVAGTTALGVLSGGSGSCRGGSARTVYQPVNPILTENNLTLVTANGNQPAPTPTTTTPTPDATTASPTPSATSATPSKPATTTPPPATGPCDTVKMEPAPADSGKAPEQFTDGWDAAPVEGCTHVDGFGRKVVLTAQQNRMFYRVNQMRAIQNSRDGLGRTPLEPDFCLQEFAQGYAESKPGGHSPMTMKFYPYSKTGKATGSAWIGENFGYSSGHTADQLAQVDRMVYGWFTSGTLTRGHYGNMMDVGWTKGGMGTASVRKSMHGIQNFSANYAMWTDLDGTSCSQPPGTLSSDSTLPPTGPPR